MLLDANVLALLVVGRVNRARIAKFKRTRRYDESAFDLLLAILEKAAPAKLFAIPHIFAEVSNLTDLEGKELLAARLVLQTNIQQSEELHIASLTASKHVVYSRLGLTDAAISTTAAEGQFAVLTDDLDLYLALSGQGTPSVNFTHLRQLQMVR
jgi:predicted nucleic acid-binding protein